ncbi:MAG TPA: hypothetical protein VGR68_06020, partial [Actinomycetota bacterium]|nr:hypothetical protein [Actinomycetota bacterium]
AREPRHRPAPPGGRSRAGAFTRDHLNPVESRAAMRTGTAIVVAALLVVIVLAAAVQLVLSR